MLIKVGALFFMWLELDSPAQLFSSQLKEECESPDLNKSVGLGKKMKEISLTMRRKMGKKHAKSFSDETVSHFPAFYLPRWCFRFFVQISFSHKRVLLSCCLIYNVCTNNLKGHLHLPLMSALNINCCAVFLKSLIIYILYKPTSLDITQLLPIFKFTWTSTGRKVVFSFVFYCNADRKF